MNIHLLRSENLYLESRYSKIDSFYFWLEVFEIFSNVFISDIYQIGISTNCNWNETSINIGIEYRLFN